MKYKKKKKEKKIAFIDTLVSKLKKNTLPLEDFLTLLKENEEKTFNTPQLEMELLISNGLPIDIIDNNVVLTTTKTLIKNQIFCIVDIETNGNSAKNGQIIEIGALKYKNGKIIDKYESLVYAEHIPTYIQKVTNITPKMLENAPLLKVVLEEFKIFLEDHVFVAHNIKFDYQFISDSFKKYDLGKIHNRSLCTIDLAKRTIKAERYGLDFLKELLHIKIDNHHRAYSDALSTSYIFKNSMSNLTQNINTTEELIDFCKSDNLIHNNKN